MVKLLDIVDARCNYEVNLRSFRIQAQWISGHYVFFCY